MNYGQDYLRLDPSDRTQKQQGKLTDHFVKWYNLVVTNERIKEFEKLDKKLQKLAEEYPELTEARTMAQNQRHRCRAVLPAQETGFQVAIPAGRLPIILALRLFNRRGTTDPGPQQFDPHCRLQPGLACGRCRP